MMPHHSQFSLLARPCFSPVTSTSGPKTLLRRCFRLLRSRHLSSSTRHRVSPALDIQPWIKAKEVVRPAAIWLVPNGSQFDQQQVLDQIPWLQNSNEDLPVSLFLVTPRFAHLFQNAHGFHSRLINSIYRGSAIDSLRQSIVAVVDALPILDKATGNPQPEIDGGEGFAVCVLPGVDVSPATDKDEKQPLISLTGRHPFFDGRRYVSVSFKGSVANTTFVNGQQSTIFMQNWWKESDHEWLPEPRQQKLSHFDIPIYANVNRDPLPALMNAKVIKLTEPKVISSSMGNIVRSVKTADGDEFAASHELERVVPRLLKDLQNSFPKTDLRVFALVYPPKLAGENSFSDRIWNKGKDHMSFHVGLHRKKLLSLLVRGARLYRVTSGGAGWGKKAGLLSLEPTTDLQTPTEQSPTLLSFIFGEDEEIRMPGSADLFPPGYFIQFLATCHDPEGMKKMAVSIEGLKSSMKNSECLLPAQWAEPDQVQQFCVGNTVLPGIHDYNPVPNESDDEHGRSASDWKTNPGLKFCPHRFGFLTSSALGISVKYHSPNQRIQAQLKFGVDPLEVSQADMNHKHSSLVEIPNSYFLARSAAGGRLSKEAARHFAGSNIVRNLPTAPRPATSRDAVEDSIAVAGQRLRTIERLQKDSYLARKEKPLPIRYVGGASPAWNTTEIDTAPITKRGPTPKTDFEQPLKAIRVKSDAKTEKGVRRFRNERLEKTVGSVPGSVVRRVESGPSKDPSCAVLSESESALLKSSEKVDEEIQAIEELIEDL